MSELWISPDELGPYANTEFSFEAAKAASNLLWALSGRRYTGAVTVTERYICTHRAFLLGPSAQTFNATLLDGNVYNIPREEFNDFAELTSDGLSPTSRIRLRGKPVQKIHTIRTRAGRVVNPSSYYLVDHSTIQAASGVPWTPCDIEVTYTYGSAVPTLGKMAARTLAIEFAKLWSGDDECALPQRITSVARQGVSYTILDPHDFIDELRTGIYSIDLFLKSVNPDGARNRAKVFNPDIPRARRYTRNAPKMAKSVFDIIIPAGTDANGVLSMGLDDLNAGFLTDPGWTVSATINNYGYNNQLILDNVDYQSLYLDTDLGTLDLVVSYKDALKTLGMVNPGTWDLYASRPAEDDPTALETIYIVSGNLTIQLADSTTPNVYVAGNPY